MPHSCGLCPQLLHWKLRNVCGQDYRGQVAEGIWHPFKAWFWRYVSGLYLFFGVSCSVVEGIYMSVFVYTLIFTTHSSGIRRRVGLWQNTGNSFEVTATMSLLCIYSHIEDGCSWRNRAHTPRRAVKHFVFLKPGGVSVLICNTFLIRGVSWPPCVSEHLICRSRKTLLPH